MKTHQNKPRENNKRTLVNTTSQKKSGNDSAFQLKDNRAETAAQTKFQEMGNNSPQVKELESVQKKAINNSIPQGQPIQKKSIPGVSGYGNFTDLGNGLFGTTQPTDAGEVAGLVNEIRANTEHQNIKVLTGTHGTQNGDLVGEHQFYTEDMVHEGHKVPNGGWINVLDVVGKSKSAIAGWMVPGNSVIILAWCYSKKSVENWENIHHATKDPKDGGKVIW